MPANVETMAYMNDTPWHGIGSRLTPDASIDVWREESGTNWTVEQSPVEFTVGDEVYFMEDRVVNYRSDTHVPLGVVSKDWKPFHGRDVLEFYRRAVEGGDFQMETAGCLNGGKKVWGLAKGTAKNISKGETIAPYLLLATAMDGSMSTTAFFTSIRVVCQNTLQMALNDGRDRIKISHRSNVDIGQLHKALGLVDDSFDNFLAEVDRFASKKMSAEESRRFYAEVLFPNEPVENVLEAEPRILKQVEQARLSAPGHDTTAANGTLWGTLNGLTFWEDHSRRTRTEDARLNSSWFGPGRAQKDRAIDLARELVG